MTSMGLRGEFDDSEPEARRPGRRSSDDQGGARVTMVVAAYVGLLITIGTLIFTAGYNWRRITEVSDGQESLRAHIEMDYVRKDVDQQNQLTVEAKLEEIKVQLEVLQRAAERQAEKER